MRQKLKRESKKAEKAHKLLILLATANDSLMDIMLLAKRVA